MPACSTASSWARRARPTQDIATAIRLGVRNPPSATSRPLPSSPSRLATGTGVRSKVSRAWSVPRTPMVSDIGSTVTPGELRSTSSATVPSLPVVPASRANSSQ